MNKTSDKNQPEKQGPGSYHYSPFKSVDIKSMLFQAFCLGVNFVALFFLAALLFQVGSAGSIHLSFDFLTQYPSRFPQKAGILSAIAGTSFMMMLTALIAVPVGLGAAIYMEEYAKETKLLKLIRINIQNLAGVPSIIYGLLGLTLFVRGMGMGRSLMAGSLTMALLILPVIIISAQEALRAVPDTFRWAGFACGLTRWQVIYHIILPVALPGMSTGVILALSRAIGEAAPMVMIGALSFVAFLPSSLFDSFTVLPIQIFNWAARPQQGFHEIAATAIIVLLVLLLIMNSVAIYIRHRYRKKLKQIYH